MASQTSSDNMATNQHLHESFKRSGETSAPSDPSHPLNPDAISALMGPSDAELMREAMAAITSPDVSLDNKMIAFDNLEQLIEDIDNANNLEVLGLWKPLAEQLGAEQAEMRKMAAWCVGTAVQNNAKTQEQAIYHGVIPRLVKLAVSDPDKEVRKKAVYALSSAVRNCPPALSTAMEALPEEYKSERKIDAGNMEEVNALIGRLTAKLE